MRLSVPGSGAVLCCAVLWWIGCDTWKGGRAMWNRDEAMIVLSGWESRVGNVLILSWEFEPRELEGLEGMSG